jgi:hypothetical protein
MSQSTLDDDELFGEAASEMREDVEAGLAAAREELPDPEAIWEIEADNTLGALNGLRSALSVEGAEDELRDAKKWYTMGERADAFEDADALASEIEDVETLLGDLAAAREGVGDLAATLPQVRSALQDVDAAEGASDEDAGDAGDVDTSADADADPDADVESEADAESGLLDRPNGRRSPPSGSPSAPTASWFCTARDN